MFGQANQRPGQKTAKAEAKKRPWNAQPTVASSDNFPLICTGENYFFIWFYIRSLEIKIYFFVYVVFKFIKFFIN